MKVKSFMVKENRELVDKAIMDNYARNMIRRNFGVITDRERLSFANNNREFKAIILSLYS